MDSALLDGTSVLKHALSAKARWHRLVQIHSPSSPITPRTENMGCVPSRPSESFYHEYFAARPEKKAKERQTTTKKNIQSKKDKSNPEHLDAKTEVVSKNHDDSRELTYEEQVARADLRIYQEEMEAKKAEEERRVYLIHRAINGNGDWVF